MICPTKIQSFGSGSPKRRELRAASPRLYLLLTLAAMLATACVASGTCDVCNGTGQIEDLGNCDFCNFSARHSAFNPSEASESSAQVPNSSPPSPPDLIDLPLAGFKEYVKDLEDQASLPGDTNLHRINVSTTTLQSLQRRIESRWLNGQEQENLVKEKQKLEVLRCLKRDVLDNFNDFCRRYETYANKYLEDTDGTASPAVHKKADDQHDLMCTEVLYSSVIKAALEQVKQTLSGFRANNFLPEEATVSQNITNLANGIAVLNKKRMIVQRARDAAANAALGHMKQSQQVITK